MSNLQDGSVRLSTFDGAEAEGAPLEVPLSLWGALTEAMERRTRVPVRDRIPPQQAKLAGEALRRALLPRPGVVRLARGEAVSLEQFRVLPSGKNAEPLHQAQNEPLIRRVVELLESGHGVVATRVSELAPGARRRAKS